MSRLFDVLLDRNAKTPMRCSCGAPLEMQYSETPGRASIRLRVSHPSGPAVPPLSSEMLIDTHMLRACNVPEIALAAHARAIADGVRVQCTRQRQTQALEQSVREAQERRTQAWNERRRAQEALDAEWAARARREPIPVTSSLIVRPWPEDPQTQPPQNKIDARPSKRKCLL